MNAATANLAALLGRILLAVMFVLAGYGKIGGFEGTVSSIASKDLPLPAVLAVLTIVLELVAGLALIAGYRARWAALALAAFTVAATLLFHSYWAFPVEQQRVQQLMFMKNLAVTGGLLMVFAFGAGAWSFDRRRVAGRG
jgi:putative oxidoreductase